jgi:hypothetical protein
MPPDTPFTPFLPLVVNIPINDKGKDDIYIDDTIFVVPDINDNLERGVKAAPLAINTFARPVTQLEPIPRKPLISMKHFLAEASFKESKTVLGWIINTRSLTAHQPPNKLIAWLSSINSILTKQTSSSKELHSLEGCLNHATYIIPTMRHFLNRIRNLRFSSAQTRRKILKVPSPVLEDLRLCQKILHWAADGISLNLVSFRQPSIFYRSDKGETGLGGYNIYSGAAWHLKLPTRYIKRAHINTLEFLVFIISIWVDMYNNKVQANDCILSQTDSTTAAGWLRKSNFSDSLLSSESSLCLIVAWKLASLIIDSSTCLYYQWLKGDSNNIPDALSRAHHLSNTELSSLLTSFFPDQTTVGTSYVQQHRRTSDTVSK